MAENFLQLTQDKPEVLVIGPDGQWEKLLPKPVKNLAVIFDRFYFTRKKHYQDRFFTILRT